MEQARSVQSSTPPRFRGDESAISKYGSYAVHVIGRSPYLYKKQELVGHIDELPDAVKKLKSANICLSTARQALSGWSDLSIQQTATGQA